MAKMNESPSRLSRRLRTILHRVHTLICWVASRQQRTDYVRTQRPRAPVCRRRPRGQTGSTQGDRGIQDARSDGWVFTALQQLFFCHCEPKVKGGEDCCLCFCDVLATLLQYKPRWHGSTCTSCQCMCTAGDHQSMCTAATVEYDRTPMQLQFMIEIGSGRGRHSGRVTYGRLRCTPGVAVGFTRFRTPPF
jgi:hypothetical protein